MGGEVLTALVDRTGVDPAAIEDVIMGCVSQIGQQSFQLARNAIFASRLPDSVPGTTVDRQCGSSQQAVHFAAQAVMSGTQDLVIAAGIESMTRVPMLSPTNLALEAGLGSPWSQRVLDRFGVTEFSQFNGAEMITEKYGFTREQLDAYALLSHQRGAKATQEGAFQKEIVALEIVDAEGRTGLHNKDEGIRYDASLEAMAQVKTIRPGGYITAANASQMTDGAAAILIANEKAIKAHGLKPLARIHQMHVHAGDPVIMLEEPIPGTARALAKAGMTIADIDLYEVNEAFAPVPMAWLKAIEADPSKLNVHGGAIALGHPLGATGTKIMTTLVHALHRHGKRYGLQAICEGGGTANVTIIERI
ncbi:acetyl-CoA C-acetyltransferase [Sphingobium xenophagum]|uniref:Acetyl-CoA C-acetyltransferase n=1 Tax=Sphingobium xenophagum TaxID=121428 RepID=A0ABU1X2D0_SPHXE|nr:acetyl-CoA C-acetyltransferase [Sphingobium xenophagum]